MNTKEAHYGQSQERANARRISRDSRPSGRSAQRPFYGERCLSRRRRSARDAARRALVRSIDDSSREPFTPAMSAWLSLTALAADRRSRA